MSFDLEQTLKDMLDSARGVFADEWPMVKDDMERVFNDEREALRDIADARLRNEIDDEETEEDRMVIFFTISWGLNLVTFPEVGSVWE